MIWDRDVSPEGIYESVDFRLIDTESVKATGWFTAGQFVLDNETGTGAAENANSELWAYQLGFNPKFKVPGLEKPLGWTSSVSWYDYSDYANNSNFGTLARGNANAATGDTGQLDAKDFGVVEFYNELNIPVMGVPVRPFADFARNMSNKAPPASGGASSDDAYAFGLTLGSAKTKGQWEATYVYKNIEPNSVVGAFNDSDFGQGHSDKRGSQFKAKYMLTDFLELGATAFFVNNVLFANTTTSGVGLRDEEQRRFQVDLVWKW
jgi:hypothetical protein